MTPEHRDTNENHAPMIPPTPMNAEATTITDRERRKKLVDLEYGLRALEAHAAALAGELRDLEGFSLSSILAGLRGNRLSRIEELRIRLDEVQQKCAAAEAAATAVREEIGDLESSTGGGFNAADQTSCQQPETCPPCGDTPAGDSGSSSGQAATSKPPDSADERRRVIQRAIEACTETRKGLLAEMETASTLGRCNVLAVRGGLNGLLRATRNRTRTQLANQVRNDLRRFLSRYAEAIAVGVPPIPEEEEVLRQLGHAADHFSGDWLRLCSGATSAADDLVQALALADMLLEKRLKDAAV